jgi:hypothetical protein
VFEAELSSAYSQPGTRYDDQQCSQQGSPFQAPQAHWPRRTHIPSPSPCIESIGVRPNLEMPAVASRYEMGKDLRRRGGPLGSEKIR